MQFCDKTAYVSGLCYRSFAIKESNSQIPALLAALFLTKRFLHNCFKEFPVTDNRTDGLTFHNSLWVFLHFRPKGTFLAFTKKSFMPIVCCQKAFRFLQNSQQNYTPPPPSPLAVPWDFQRIYLYI